MTVPALSVLSPLPEPPISPHEQLCSHIKTTKPGIPSTQNQKWGKGNTLPNYRIVDLEKILIQYVLGGGWESVCSYQPPPGDSECELLAWGLASDKTPSQAGCTHPRGPAISRRLTDCLRAFTLCKMEISYIVDQSRELDFRKGIP